MMQQDSRRRPARTARWFAAVAVAAIVGSAMGGCGILSPSGPGSRTFAMGFTPFPYANTAEAEEEAWNIIAADADLAVIQLDGGVPWQAALDGTAWPQPFMDELEFYRNRIPLGHAVYVAATPISPSRSGLALNRDEFGANQPLPQPWNTYEFNSPEVIEAFTRYCETLIELFDPDYFAYAIEANRLRRYSPTQWDDFVDLAREVYDSIKWTHPSLPVFLTLRADTYHASPFDQEEAILDIVYYTDVMALSAYPFARPLSDPTALEDDYFSAVSDIAPGLPFAIAETVWPAQDVEEPYPVEIEATVFTQEQYVERLLEECELGNASFLCWFYSRDFDDFWETDLRFEPGASTIRLYRDTGLIDGNGYDRPAMGLWRQELVIPR